MLNAMYTRAGPNWRTGTLISCELRDCARNRLPGRRHLAQAMPRLIIDRREHQLLRMMPDVEAATLEVGDVMCHNESGSGWIAERKTASDLARSLRDGRWEDQCDRLLNSGMQAVIIIEGSLRDADFPYEPLWGCMCKRRCPRRHNVIPHVGCGRDRAFGWAACGAPTSPMSRFWAHV